MGRPPSDEEIIATLADDLPVGVWVARAPGGEFVHANKTFAEIMGTGGLRDVVAGSYSRRYGLRTRAGDFYPEAQLPFARAIAERRSVVADDIVVHRPDSGEVDVRAEARPVFDDDNQITHVVMSLTNITREVVSAAARAEMAERQQHAQKMDAIGGLAGGIAHDFNNLIAVVKMVASTMKLTETDPEKLEGLRQIDQVTHSAQQLTRSLLGFARRGKNLDERVALNDVVQSVAELVQRTVDRRIAVSIECAALPGETLGDISQLEQLAMNLALNARDAITAHGTITLRTRDVVLGDEESRRLPPLQPGRHVLLEVIDDGVGIAHDIRHRIFEPYFTTKGAGGPGTGLGLATVYGIVQSHGGAVEVLDNQPQGTIMRAFLPAAPASRRARRTPTPALGIRMGQGTILVVEDEPLVRTATRRALRSLGYEVLTADDGVEALEVFREHQADIEAVLLDMIMPRMGGRETYLALRAIVPDVRVLLTTGYALNEEAQRILDAGVRGFIAKPFEISALSVALNAVIEAP